MATTAHHVVSHYTTPEQEGDEVPEHEIEALWNAESAKIKVAKRPYRIPTFVKGSTSEGGSLSVGEDVGPEKRMDDSISGWYQELAASRAAAAPVVDPSQVASTSTALVPATQAPRSASLPTPPKAKPRPRGKERRAQPDWFIHRALETQAKTQSEPSSLHSTPRPSGGLADLLAQQPPPKPDEPAFKPPIWYALDPTNKGFAMLRKSGWEEGYGLGHAHPPAKSAPVTRISTPLSEQEESQNKIIDLTASRSPTPEGDTIFEPTPPPALQLPESSDTPHGTALLTPLRPVLKADRLGIGLKAKKKSSLKSKEIREHIRAGQEAQRKAELERRGKGWRAFARQAKKDSEERRALMSYFNS